MGCVRLGTLQLNAFQANRTSRYVLDLRLQVHFVRVSIVELGLDVKWFKHVELEELAECLVHIVRRCVMDFANQSGSSKTV